MKTLGNSSSELTGKIHIGQWQSYGPPESKITALSENALEQIVD